jgi:DNA-binding NarL/FixJ family response regulator
MLTKERAKYFGEVDRTQPSLVSLSRRQREILSLLIQGRTSREIAYVLDIDDRTVDYHVAQICIKSGVWSRRELVILALRNEYKAA